MGNDSVLTPASFFNTAKVKEEVKEVIEEVVEEPVKEVVEEVVEEPVEEVVEKSTNKYTKKQKDKLSSKAKILSTPVVPALDKVTILKNHLNVYKKYYNSNNINDDMRQKILQQFYLIVRYVINNPEKDVIHTLYLFFVENSKGILGESVVFQGLSKMNKSQRMQIETFYTLMMALIRNKVKKEKFGISLEAARRILKVDGIINYVASNIVK